MTPGWVEMLLRRRWEFRDCGRDYARGRVDCHGFTLGAALEVFGLVYPDPAYASALEPAHVAAVELGRRGCTRVSPSQRQPGDLVLLQRADRWHTALYGGEGRVLHMSAAGLTYPALRGLLGRRVEGYYRGWA